MAGLSDLLAGDRFIQGYDSSRTRGMQDQQMQLQQAQGLMQLLQQAQAQQLAQRKLGQENAYRGAVSGLGENPTQEQLIGIASKFGSPEKVMDVHQKSLDRKAAAEQAAMQFATKLQEAAQARQQKHEEFQQRQTDQNARAAEAMSFKRDMMAFQQQGAAFSRHIAQQGLDIRRQMVEQVNAGKRPIEKTDAQGNTKLFDYQGNLIKDLGAVGLPSAQVQKTAVDKQKTVKNIDEAIIELKKATADGGLIDKSTGSGAGALVDIGAGFFGAATPGAVASGELAPIFDLVLKMVPRFEGPQSDKDTQSYKEAAGQLANPRVPNKIKKEAGKTVLRLLEKRRDQFVSKDAPVEAPPPSGGVKFLGFEPK